MTGPAHIQDPQRTCAALDELALLLLNGESTQTVLQKVVDLVQRVMPSGADVSITLMRNDQATTAAFTGQLALDLDETQYACGHGPCMEAAVGGLAIEINEGRTESRWPDYMPTFLSRGALSSLAVPVPAAQLSAGLNVYSPSVEAFSAEAKAMWAQTCLRSPLTSHPCAADSRATRWRPRPPSEGSRATAGVGGRSGAASLTSSSQPRGVVPTVT